MKDLDYMKDYTTKLMTILNQIRLVGEEFPNQMENTKLYK